MRKSNESVICNVSYVILSTKTSIGQIDFPKQGIFYNGQVFDAHTFTSNLFCSAKKSLLIIDNFIDDTVLTLLSKRKTDVSATIYTKKISKQLELDLHKHNEQYPEISSRGYCLALGSY
ncbi:MAG: hypothetical protein OCC49_10355 [Fibrobacterales bacterium]